MLTSLRLQNFRSYNDATFEFEPGVNIVVGPNASGKTNLIEAILVLFRGSSYRSNDQLITHGAKWARIDGDVAGTPRSARLKIDGDKTNKEFHIGGTVLHRLPLARRLPVVVFEPAHLQLLTESPEKRRAFFDDIIEQTSLGYEKTRRDYKRALAQRNALLKRKPSPDQLFVWDVRLSELGAQIASARQEFIAKHQDRLVELYETLAHKKHVQDSPKIAPSSELAFGSSGVVLSDEEVSVDTSPAEKLVLGSKSKSGVVGALGGSCIASLRYQTTVPNTDYSGGMLKQLKARLNVDIERGFTTTGPHRDDIVPLLDGHELMLTGSRGEVRTMLLALKLLELSALEEALDTKPILLLDDVFSELDGARRRALTSYLKDHQTFITTTDADIVIQHFLENCHVIPTG